MVSRHVELYLVGEPGSGRRAFYNNLRGESFDPLFQGNNQLQTRFPFKECPSCPDEYAEFTIVADNLHACMVYDEFLDDSIPRIDGGFAIVFIFCQYTAEGNYGDLEELKKHLTSLQKKKEGMPSDLGKRVSLSLVATAADQKNDADKQLFESLAEEFGFRFNEISNQEEGKAMQFVVDAIKDIEVRGGAEAADAPASGQKKGKGGKDNCTVQ
mmetsp:Transcript_10965/g.27705  ORF Transcript_10965/g.27705 Transcript_10965/m.27705 type:complete len:213 (+) Transcript_10965:172-810(+)